MRADALPNDQEYPFGMRCKIKVLFWSSLALIFFAYAGYPILLYLRTRFWSIPVCRASIFPGITILVAVYNEEKNLPRKLTNLAALDYPADRLEVIVVSDGSLDGTHKILDMWDGPNLRTVRLPMHRGKATALNVGAAEAKGEIIVFTDARQTIAPDALKIIVANFADPCVGCVSGELMLPENPSVCSSEGLGLYWRVEKKIRYWEGLVGSTIGATGALYAVRKKLLWPIPDDLILDDVYIPLQVVRQGLRVVCEPRALAWDDLMPSAKQEFRRKLRTLIGNYQLLQLAPWILTTSNPLLLQFVCHKVLRLLIPFALLTVLVSTVWLREGVYGFVLALQLLFYLLAGLGMFQLQLGILSRLSNVFLAFMILNTAAGLAFVYFITGRKAIWAR
jgi:biofilm PGA synthesis N-glycosyltransferase PgaC